MRNIEYTLPSGRGRAALTSVVEPERQSLAPRVARLLALAHKLDGLIRSGAIRDYAELARLGRITPARLSQILMLLNLSPAIQEFVLFLTAAEARPLAESDLRAIARELSWAHQGERFEELRDRRR
jgi:hypothetical protein